MSSISGQEFGNGLPLPSSDSVSHMNILVTQLARLILVASTYISEESRKEKKCDKRLLYADNMFIVIVNLRQTPSAIKIKIK